jgi:AraC-like DNA-binding protein
MDLVTSEIGGDNPELEKEVPSASGTDLPPEYCHYRDEGCEYAQSCLACPFPQCLYDEPRGRQRWLKELRNKEINKLFSGGWKIKELALLFGVSQRTIQRALRDEVSGKLSVNWFKGKRQDGN